MDGTQVTDRVGVISTGLIKANGFAIKIRKVAFAQLSRTIASQEIARGVAALNQAIFLILRSLGVEKEDVVRIRVPYRISGGSLIWIPEKAEIEVYKEHKIRKEDKIRERLGELLSMDPEKLRSLLEGSSGNSLNPGA